MLLDTSSRECSPAKWREEMSKADPVVGHAAFMLNGDPIVVFARFTGVPHGPQNRAFECTISGNPKNAKHAALHGRQEYAADRAACLLLFSKLALEVTDAGGTVI